MIEQLEIDLHIQHRCLRCNRPINHYGMGRDCEKKVIAEFLDQYGNYTAVIYSYLNYFYKDNSNVYTKPTR